MSHPLEQSMAWVDEGTALFVDTVLRGEDLRAPSGLPGWSRAHVISHVARNADALVNLLTWARTGVETRMYPSAAHRAADIESGSHRDALELLNDLQTANERFATALRGQPTDRWASEVRTARDRPVPASEVPWMRTREVWMHAVDLDCGVGLADLPIPLIEALLDDAVAMFDRAGNAPSLRLWASDTGREWKVGGGADTVVTGVTTDLAGYALGRPVAGELTTIGESSRLPVLPAWL